MCWIRLDSEIRIRFFAPLEPGVLGFSRLLRVAHLFLRLGRWLQLGPRSPNSASLALRFPRLGYFLASFLGRHRASIIRSD